MKHSLQYYLSEVHHWNLEAGHMEQAPDNLNIWEDDEDHRQLALALIEEEVEELAAAVSVNDKVETADAIADILFTLFGLAAKSGQIAVVEECLGEVIESNWTKLGGERVVLPSGKIGKPEGYKPPKIAPIVARAEDRGFL